ncbi:MAG TPA: enoyl-CoA hydratase/isomerase family protein [Solirubrobacteraceae bacterium]
MSEEVTVELREDHVAVVEFDRPPHNFFDAALIEQIADAYERLDGDRGCRAIVLCSAGRHFCAGANFAAKNPAEGGHLYDQAIRLFTFPTPVVAAVQGAAIGGGLGVALSADFRVASPESRFSANFSRLGIHHGFGLTVTLPLVVGEQRALELLYTGERVRGDDAHAIGLCDRLVPADELRPAAITLAAQIAAAAPLAIRSIRSTMRGGLAERVRAATAHELEEQGKLFGTADFAEGIAASGERREPAFKGE